MEFGRVDAEELSAIDFSLPADKEENALLLATSKTKNIKAEVYVGCAKWGRKDWVGKIYPLKTKEADFLNHYARHFNCIELNATFYKMPTEKQTSAWKNKVGEDFKFCPKFIDQITHLKRLKDVNELTERFLTGIVGFGKNLGPVFLMPHPGMGPKDFDVIEAFIKSLPKDLDLFVELRLADWFQHHESFQRVSAMFEKNNAGSVITDSSGRRDCVHMRLTKPEVFIRFVGNGLHPTDYSRIDEWVERIRTWIEKGIEKVYFFMHQHDELHSPELSLYLIQQLNKKCNLNIPEPVFVKNQSLFS